MELGIEIANALNFEHRAFRKLAQFEIAFQKKSATEQVRLWPMLLDRRRRACAMLQATENVRKKRKNKS